MTEVWMIAVALFIVLGLYLKIITLEKQLKVVKSELKRVKNEVEMPPHPVDDTVKALLIHGKEIQAIKEVRLALGLSLLEAKQYVDNLK